MKDKQAKQLRVANAKRVEERARAEQRAIWIADELARHALKEAARDGVVNDFDVDYLGDIDNV